MNLDIFNQHESEVRSYCRSFPTLFTRAKGSQLFDAEGKAYLDFFAGAGALNYGHNPDELKRPLMDYIMNDGVTHSLDMSTEAKGQFMQAFYETILKPRNLDYKMMFIGPTGTNAVESALKLARKATGRENIVYFTNGFHGMTLGSLSVTGNSSKRGGAGVPLNNTTSMPFDGYYNQEMDTLTIMEEFLKDASSGLDTPAAFIVETVQAEGGINVASVEWLQRLESLAREYGILLIIDDIQVGCGRTGPFFSFERAGISPDMICLSKSLSGYGVPFALNLIKPEYDLFSPGEHNGTFRGHNLAFITAKAALNFWKDDHFSSEVKNKGKLIHKALSILSNQLAAKYTTQVKGLGMIQGLDFTDTTLPGKISQICFEKGLIIETAGPDDNVLKLLPPLTIPQEQLERGLDIIAEAISEATGLSVSLKASALV